MQDELQDKVVYGDHQIKYLRDEIEKEQHYRWRAKREQKNNQKIALVTYVICFFLLLGLLFLAGWGWFFSKASPSIGFPIFLLVAGPIMIFMAAFLAFFCVRFGKYMGRVRGDVDWKTFAYKKYDDMELDSKAREQYLKKELIKTEMTREMNQELIEQLQKQIAMEDMKVINIEELHHVQLEKQNEVQEPVDEKNMGRLLEEGENFEE